MPSSISATSPPPYQAKFSSSIVERAVAEPMPSTRGARTWISIVVSGFTLPILFLICCATPIINRLYVFTLRVYIVNEPTRVVDYGLWGYCIRAFENQPVECSSPKLGWQITENVIEFLRAPELRNAVSSARSSVAVMVPINVVLVIIAFTLAIVLYIKNRNLNKDLKLKAFILPMGSSGVDLQSHLRTAKFILIYNCILFFYSVITALVTFSLGWALFDDIANASGGSDVWLTFGPAPALLTIAILPQIWNLWYLFTLRTELRILESKSETTPSKAPPPPSAQPAFTHRLST